MRQHAYKATWWRRLDWRFVAWCLGLALLVALLVIAHLLLYIARMS